MKIKYQLVTLIIILVSCSPKPSITSVKELTTSKFQEIQKTMVVPDYIGTSINCINIASQSNWEERNRKIVINYFSEFSSIYFFITISDKQIYFETYNDTGSPKPNLIFYVQSVESDVSAKIFDYFENMDKFKEIKKLSSSDNKTLSLEDNIKQNFGEQFGGDKFPLTKKEAIWLVKRNLLLIQVLTQTTIKFDKNLIAPVFYNMCNYEKEFKNWQLKYPEINEHKLNY